MTDLRDIDVIAPNFKERITGVTATVVQLVPFQRAQGLRITAFGRGLPPSVEQIGLTALLGLWRKPASGRPFRIWHSRRNIEMLTGIILKDVLKAPLRLVFTWAGQRSQGHFTKWMMRRMDAIVSTSRRCGSYLDVPHVVVMHGVDTESFHPASNADDDFAASGLKGKFAIGCFGRVRHMKGTDLFVNAMISLLPEFPDWTAVIAGRVTGEHQDFARELESRARDAGLSERIVFLGEVSYQDIKAWYRRLTLYVAPSRKEGFGLTPLEAMASGTAVVASDAGAYGEMIEEGKTGSVVPAGDSEALSVAIRRYMADPGLATRHGKNASAVVRENFALKREADGLVAVYEDVWSAR